MNRLNVRKSFFLTLIVGCISYFFIDQKIITLIASYSKTYHTFFRGCTLLIFPPLYLALATGGWILARLKQSKWSPLLFEILVAQFLSTIFVRIFKIIIGRARPEIFLREGFYGFYGFELERYFHSFPSGHSMAAFTLSTSLALLFPRFRSYFFSLAAALTTSRILLLDHFPSDVIGTAAISLLIAGGIHHFINAVTRSFLYETP